MLYINSYAISYSWSDSITVGILETFREHKNIMLYAENLDAKRFGRSDFKKHYNNFKDKYKNTVFSVIVASDNDALDFLLEYGDSLFKNVPVVFCGIGNIEDYSFNDKRFYGIQEKGDVGSVINLITTMLPRTQKMYFFSDSTTTSLINLKYVKSLEPRYKNNVKFEYVSNISTDSIISLSTELEDNSVIALLDIYSDKNNNHINTDLLVERIAKVSNAPLFIGSETTLGKGIIGGRIISGSNHGRDVSKLALQFIFNPEFTPENRVVIPDEQYFFDYNVLRKFNINLKLIPENSVIINKPTSVIRKYLEFFIWLTLFIIFLLVIILFLSINISRRKKAEKLVSQKLSEIEKKNLQLEKFNISVKEMNVELEISNEKHEKTNEALKIALNKAEESEKLKSIFLANISHEIRTPMNAIIGFSDLLKDATIDTSVKENYINTIQHESYQLLHIIEGIVELSKIEAQKLNLDKKEGNFLDFLADIYDEMQFKLPLGKEIDLVQDEVKIDGSAIIHTDFIKLRGVLTKLISNAIKYTKQGVVRYGCSIKDSNTMEFYVKDQGIGISKEFHEIIFKKFRQVHDSSIVLQSGSGVGLAIAKSYIEILDGKIWVESEPGKGSTFYFSIPYLPVK